ncbi:DUF3592 domain-containing protein [Streptacidiphilus sp. PB12-B1b]|uniref:DUF3592 domain-containing protein n=1 Tax=Streptacidiphilus sp. PB12-B1b TaxID=2705012 RepID=UPI0015F7B7D8|nr:DUF3592 domain-containing protein [Streptacidiphilus sp. PB12-B1b]QMU77614.1 DUF3592 domain-containing protein [Streptacidiphilus sp. PB12-B1b]
MRLGILAVVFGGPLTALFVVSMVKRLFPMLRASRSGVVVQGTVLRVKAHHGGANGFRTFSREAHIEFTTADGERMTYVQLLESGVECRTGEAVTVRYSPANPRDSATIKDPYDVTTGLLVTGGLALLFGVVLVFGVLLILGVVHADPASA